MCFQDWRIGRLIRAQTTVITLASGASFVIPRNSIRVGISFGNYQGSGSIIVLPDSLPTTGGEGWDPAIGGPLHFTLATHGDLPTRPWYLVCNIALGTNVSFTEYFATEKGLAMGLQEFQRQYGGGV